MSTEDGWPEVASVDYLPSDWRMDPKGYFLIRLNREKKTIEVGFLSPKGEKLYRLEGRHPIEIYYTIMKKGSVSRLEHAAYLGLELQKAYTALQLGIGYVQDDELAFSPAGSGAAAKTKKKQ